MPALALCHRATYVVVILLMGILILPSDPCLAAAGRGDLDLSGPGWTLWLDEDAAWVEEHVMPVQRKYVQVNKSSVFGLVGDMLDALWGDWSEWRDKGAVMVADCPFPVESRALHTMTQETGRPTPYPVLDVMTARVVRGLPTTADRLHGELPAHHPVADARQSIRLFLETL